MDLTDEEIQRFVAACQGGTNVAAREVMARAGVDSAGGVLARLMLAQGEERHVLVDLIRRVISEQD